VPIETECMTVHIGTGLLLFWILDDGSCQIRSSSVREIVILVITGKDIGDLYG